LDSKAFTPMDDDDDDDDDKGDDGEGDKPIVEEETVQTGNKETAKDERPTARKTATRKRTRSAD